MLLGNHEKYGIGLSTNDISRSVNQQGVIGTSQVYMGLANGQLNFNNSNSVTSFDKDELKETEVINKRVPIFTDSGKKVVIILVLAYFGYVIYKSHKAKQISSNLQLDNEVIHGNPEPIQNPTNPIPEAPPTPKIGVDGDPKLLIRTTTN